MDTATNITNSDMSYPSIDGGATSPGEQSGGGTKAVAPATWIQVVRGEKETIASVPLSPSVSSSPQSTAVIEPEAEEEGSSDCGNGNAGGMRPAWNKPSNGTAQVGPVMGAHSWPALSETTKGSSSTKSSSDSLKSLADGSAVSQGTGTANSSSQKQVSNNGNFNSSPSRTAQTGQRSMKRNGPNTSSNGGLPQLPALQGPVVEGPLTNSSPRDHTQKSGSGSQSHSGNDHSHQRGSFKNRSGRGDGSHHHNYGRRDQDRGNQDWNSHRNFNGRDGYMQPQRVFQRFMRHPPPPLPPPPPPSSAPFIPPPPPPLRPFGSPIGFHEFASPVYYVASPPPEALRGVPFVAPIPPHALFFPAVDPQLHSRIVSQIDYYFSNENLIKDTYLRQNMDEQGWVSIKLIAGFNKVSLLTDNIQLILDALQSSTAVEVQGDKVRKRNDWMRWIMTPGQYSNISSPGKSNTDMLAAQVQNMSLDQNTTNHSRVPNQADVTLSRSSSGEMSNQSTGATGQVGIQEGRNTN